MNRNQRRFGRAPKKSFVERGKVFKRNAPEIEVLKGVKDQRDLTKIDVNMRNRCCFVTPDQQDFGHITINCDVPSEVPCESIGKKRYGIESEIVSETVNNLSEIKEMLRSEFRVENSSVCESKIEHIPPKSSTFTKTSNDDQWQNIDKVDDIDKFLNEDRREQEKVETPERDSQNIHISDAPRVKVIAEKYSKYKKNNIEVRKLEEKIVCVEYDVYDLTICDTVKPMQVMRAFFTIKPVCNETTVTKLPSEVKVKYNVQDEDFQKLSDKELEIIDGKITQNKPYLDDLKKILKRNRVINSKKNKTSLDLLSLYEMAKKEQYLLDGDISKANVLSNAELQEMKDLILKRCVSSVHGMRRTKMGRPKDTVEDRQRDVDAISNSIIAEIIKQDLC